MRYFSVVIKVERKGWGAEWEDSGERREEKRESGVVGAELMGEPRGLMGEQRGLVGGQPRGRGAGKVVQGRLWAVLVKQVWSELNSRLGHGESINPSRAPAQRAAARCGNATQRKFLHQAICTPPAKKCPGCYEVEIASS